MTDSDPNFEQVLWHEEQDERLERALMQVGTPVFGMTPKWDCHRSIAGWSSDTIHLRHRTDRAWIEVATRLIRPDYDGGDVGIEERRALHMWFTSRIDSLDLEFPVQLVAHRWDAAVEIDGAPYVFSFVGDDLTWVAWGDHANRHLLIDGRGLHPGLVVLSTVDPANYETHG